MLSDVRHLANLKVSLGFAVRSRVGDEIRVAEDARSYLSSLAESEIEEFWVLALSPSKRVLAHKMLFRGTVDACMVHPRDVFRFAIISNASSIIVAHNHPSGEAYPSDQDLKTTEQMVRAGKLLQIPVLDHLLLTKTDFVSFARRRWVRF